MIIDEEPVMIVKFHVGKSIFSVILGKILDKQTSFDSGLLVYLYFNLNFKKKS